MSIDGGGIHYTIDVETQALLDAKSVTSEATTQIQNAMARTELAVKNYSDELKKMGYIVAANGTVMQKNGAIMEAQTLHMQNLQNATVNLNTKLKSTQPAFAVSGNAAQMAGYQIGDFATQVASGQSAIIAFTQQATQMLGAFGTFGAVLGAVLAVTGALVVGLAPSLLKNRDYAKELEDAMTSLDKIMTKSKDGVWEMSDEYQGMQGKIKGLSDIIKKSLENDMVKAVEAAKGQTMELIGALKDVGAGLFTAGVDEYIKAFRKIGVTSTNVEYFKEVWTELGKEFGYTGEKATAAGEKIFRALEKADRKGTAESMKEFTQTIIDMGNASGGKPSKQITDLIKIIVESTGNIDKMKEAIDNLKETMSKSPENDFIKDLQQKTALLKAELEGGELAVMQLAAAQKLGKKSSSELSAEVQKEVDAHYKAKKALDDKTESERESKKQSDKAKSEAAAKAEQLKSLLDGLEAERLKLSMTTLQWELYSKTQEAIKNGASQDVIQQIWDQVTAIDALRTKTAEAKAEEDKAEAARKERLRQLADKTENVTDKNKEFNRSQMDPIQALKDEQQEELKVLVDAYNSKLIAYDEYNKAMTDTLKRHSDERRQVELDNNMQLLSASAGFFDDMSKLAAMGGKKAFAAQKIFATASAALNFSSALAQAMADPSAITLPQKLANYGLVVSTFTSLLGSIKGSSYGGGRMYGGPVEAGRYYRINETGAPEIYSAGGKDYLMATENAKIKSAAQVAQGGGFSGNIIVNNAPPGTTASYNGRDVIVDIAKSEAEKAAAAVYNKMTNEASQNNGRFMNALNRNISSKGLA